MPTNFLDGIHQDDLMTKDTHAVSTKNPFFKVFGMEYFTVEGAIDFCREHTNEAGLITPYLTSNDDGTRCEERELFSALFYDDTKDHKGVSDTDVVNVLWWDDDERKFEGKNLSDMWDDAAYATVPFQYLSGVMENSSKVINAIYCNNVYLREEYKAKDDEKDYYDDLLGSGYDFTHETNGEFVKDIYLSGSGCIVWRPKLYFAVSSGCFREFHPEMVLRFQDPYEHRNENVIAQPIPFIAGVARTPGGHEFNANKSQEDQINDYTGGLTAAYQHAVTAKQKEQEPSLENLVAGPLHMSFNMNTGEWEAGTQQLLVRLTTDIPGVSAPGFDLNNIAESNDEAFYTKDGLQNQVGDFSDEEHIGYGLPLYVYKGNPSLFGPAFIKRHEKNLEGGAPNTKEEIPIVNRTPRSFKANQLVLCSRINGEWIPFDLGQDSGGLTFSIKNWWFQKMIASTDSFFKDERLYYNSGVNDGANQLGTLYGQFDWDADESQRNYINRITDGDYLQRMRIKFYQSLRYYMSYSGGGDNPTNEVKAYLQDGRRQDNVIESGIERGHLYNAGVLNIMPSYEVDTIDDIEGFDFLTALADAAPTFSDGQPNWDIIPSTRYLQVTAFDQMGTFAGGKLLTNVIARTNIDRGPSEAGDTEELFPPSKVIEWFGPVFPDGYDESEVQNVKNKKTTDLMGHMPSYYVGTNLEGTDSRFFFNSGDPNGANGWFIPDADNPAFMDNMKDRNISLTYGYKSESDPGGMLGNTLDNAALNLPAEVATLAPPNVNDYGGPLEDLGRLFTNYGRDIPYAHFSNLNYGIYNMIDNTSNLLSVSINSDEQSRFHWLFRGSKDDLDAVQEFGEWEDIKEYIDSSKGTPYYGLKPKVMSRLTFMPLYAPAVATTDYEVTKQSQHYIFLDLGYGMPGLVKNIWNNGANFYRPDLDAYHIFGNNSMFERNFIPKFSKQNVYDHSTSDWLANVDKEESGYTIPYNAAQNPGLVTLDSDAINWASPSFWPGSLYTSNRTVGNCVGIIAAKCSITFQGTELVFKTDQKFGLQSRKAPASGGGSDAFVAIGQAILGFQSSGGLRSEGAEPRWGRTTDNPWDFNVTALYVKIYDAWPADQTVYDARYFTVFHYNPGQPITDPEIQEEEVYYITQAEINELKDDGMTQDEIDNRFLHFPDVQDGTTVDFGVPTDIENIVIPVDFVIDHASNVSFAPTSYWRVNTIRRGMLLSNGGFRYARNACGVNEYEILEGGQNYQKDEILAVTGGAGRNAFIKIKSVTGMGGGSGGVTGIIDEIEIVDRGENYITSDFGEKVDGSYDIETSKVKVSGGEGTGASIKFKNGIIYQIIETDDGPEIRSDDRVMLTDENGNGTGNNINNEGVVEGEREVSVQLSNPNDTGKYDLFFHFHNDITHTVGDGRGEIGVEAQYVTMSLSAN